MLRTCVQCGGGSNDYLCTTCTIKKEANENRKHNEYLARQSAENTNLLNQQIVDFENLKLQELQKQTEIEFQRLEEQKKQTALIQEQVITIQDAFNEGKKLDKFELELSFNKSLNNVNAPYLNNYLNEAFHKGAQEKLNETFDEEVINILREGIISFTMEIRDLFLLYKEEIVSINDGFFVFPAKVIYKNTEFYFGSIKINLRVKTNHKTGEIFFENKRFNEPTNIEVINQDFISAFKYTETLEKVNLEEYKSERLTKLKKIAEGLRRNFDAHFDNTKNVALTFVKHETYKGRLIEFRDFQYKINSVIQTFDTLAQAKNYIDGLSSPIVTEKQSSNSITLEKNNTVSIILVLFLSSLLVYGFYYLNKKSQIDSCFDAISNNFHKFNGIDALVNIGMVKEWESDCNSMIENLGSVERKLISKSLGNDYMNARNELLSLGWEPIIFNDLNVSARDKFNAKIVNKIFKIKELNSCYPDDNNTTVICNSLWKKKNELTNIRYEAIFSYDAKSFLVTYAGIEHKASRSD